MSESPRAFAKRIKFKWPRAEFEFNSPPRRNVAARGGGGGGEIREIILERPFLSESVSRQHLLLHPTRWSFRPTGPVLA